MSVSSISTESPVIYAAGLMAEVARHLEIDIPTTIGGRSITFELLGYDPAVTADLFKLTIDKDGYMSCVNTWEVPVTAADMAAGDDGKRQEVVVSRVSELAKDLEDYVEGWQERVREMFPDA